MLNTITIQGRLTREPELRRTQSGVAVASFTLAVDRDFSDRESGQKETDFIDCVAWRGLGETVAKYFTKGQLAVITGRLQIRNWTDKDGQKRRSAEILAGGVYFCGSKENGATSHRQPDSGTSAPTDGFAEMDGDEQLPF